MTMTLSQTEVALHNLRQIKVGGNGAEASALFQETVAQASYPDAAGKLADMLLFTAVFLGDLDMIARLLPMRGLDPVQVEIDASIPGPQLFRWTHQAGLDQFSFNPGLFSLDQRMLYTIYSRWVAWTSFVIAYRRTGGAFGSCLVDVGDWSSGLGLVFCDTRKNAFLVPDSSFLASAAYRSTLVAYEMSPCPWAMRLPTALWRGASTGVAGTGLMSLPRVQLCKIASDPSSDGLLDAGITEVVQFSSPEDETMLRCSGLVRPRIPVECFHQYKYHIDIDGNTNSWPGLFQKLLTGSPVLKVDSPYRQWYYDRLVPWHNFVPVRSDMADMLEILRFLRANDSFAERIGNSGLSLAREMDVASETRSCRSVVAGAFNETKFRVAL